MHLRVNSVRTIVGGSSRASVLLVGCLIILLFFLARPGCIVQLRPHPITTLCNDARVIAIVVSLVVYFIVVRRSWFVVPVLALCGCVAASMVLNGLSPYFVLEAWAPSCAAALLGFAMSKTARKELLWATLIYFTAYSFVNAITMVVFPDGIPGMRPRYFFCGNQNQAIIAILCSFFSSVIIDAEEGRRFGVRSALIGAIGVLQVLLAHSSTTLIVFAFVLLGCFVIYRLKVFGFITLWVFLGLYVVAFVGIVILHVQELFSFLIEDILGETLDFSMRTQIWEIATEKVLNGNPLIGCGSSLYSVNGLAIPSAHNMLLETFVYGGVLAVCSLGAIWVFAAHSLYATRHTVVSALLSLELGCFLIIGLMEQTAWPALFVVLGMCAALLPLRSGQCRESGLQGIDAQ